VCAVRHRVYLVFHTVRISIDEIEVNDVHQLLEAQLEVMHHLLQRIVIADGHAIRISRCHQAQLMNVDA
jgi:hypothetical protein